jgi:two-component sensor histidine kinase
MALIHEKLYRTDNLAQIDLGEYIRDLAFYLFRAYDAKSKELSFCLEASPVYIGIDTAVPCGLIINELVTNALKHAFPNGNGGEIRIGLQTSPNNQLTITIRDNGVGFPLTTDLSQSKSLGLQLVNTLVSQLEGVITMQQQDGAEFRITLPIPP